MVVNTNDSRITLPRAKICLGTKAPRPLEFQDIDDVSPGSHSYFSNDSSHNGKKNNFFTLSTFLEKLYLPC